MVLAATTAGRADFTEEQQFGTRLTIPMAWGDADNDGDLDIAVGNFNQQNQLFINNGDGTFTEEAQFGVGGSFAVVWGDYDNDGDLDVAVGNASGQQNQLYINDGHGGFTADPQFGMNITIAMAWGDYDNDGDLDMAVGNGLLNTAQQNYLYINNGDGSFTERAEFGMGQSATIGWGDYDGDGDLDLAVGNGGFCCVEQNYLYVNNGDDTFTEVPQFGIEDTACLYWGDHNNDGLLDMAVGNWTNGQNTLYENNGDGTFSPLPGFGGRDTNTLAWGDFNNDGLLDVATGNGDFGSADSNFVYVNMGGGVFTEVQEFGLGSTDGVAWGDYDLDGDLDLAVGNEHSPTTNYLYINNENDEDYLILHLVGRFHALGAGYSNRDGIGAKVAVYEAGFIGDDNHLLGYREVKAHGGFASQNAIDPHLGLPGRATVDVRITWPGSDDQNIVQDLEGVTVPGRITVYEGLTSSDVSEPGEMKGDLGFRAFPNPMSHATSLEFVSPGKVIRTVEVFNVGGRMVRALSPRTSATGSYLVSWDGRIFNGAKAPAGVYRIVGKGKGTSVTGRVLLLH
jgi:hypothetical protein